MYLQVTFYNFPPYFYNFMAFNGFMIYNKFMNLDIYKPAKIFI